ncbi:binding-protein-dependent transport systems inner membrane component [Syntrophobotulus glycolicus DSM 8271]|uniref:Binding-protein-dependent transport systems inner membrane component n=1 Tax=Syntrophobotulus glycolicus (strain DSM 8271 / FlGlyR) TaxID=645991 RepID=F0STR0_SYNGF|nr:ABC transporter permease [Syntrophobotulus glycolicus]ADY55350.1 binding-protein-dependent transport systems inner membrane component [Syntrophobotulus glycolicus DSM 8271]
MKSNNQAAMIKRQMINLTQSIGLGGGVILVLLITWEVSSALNLVNPMFASSPARIFTALIKLFKNGEIIPHIVESSKVFAIGYLMAAVTGIPAGIALGWFKKAGLAFGPMIAAFYTTPRIALMPLFIIWFGLGVGSKLALVFLSAVFPLIVNMQTAVSNLDKDFTTVAKAYGANQRQIFFTIALPESVPFLITGLRLATGRALLGVVGAEVFGGAEGLGYLIQYAGATFQVDKVFVCVVIIAAAGIIMDRSLLALNKRFSLWRGNDH